MASMPFQTIPLSAPPMGVGNGSNGPLASVWCLVGTAPARSPFTPPYVGGMKPPLVLLAARHTAKARGEAGVIQVTVCFVLLGRRRSPLRRL